MVQPLVARDTQQVMERRIRRNLGRIGSNAPDAHHQRGDVGVEGLHFLFQRYLLEKVYVRLQQEIAQTYDLIPRRLHQQQAVGLEREIDREASAPARADR